MSCFQGGTVVRLLERQDKYAAIQEVIDRAPVFDAVGDRTRLAAAVLQRERMLSTGLGRGVAVAHGASSAVPEVVIALGISREGIDFDSFDEAPVHLLFVITNPPDRQLDYLAALAAVTKLVRDEGFRSGLQASLPPEQLEHKICLAFRKCLKRNNRIPA